MLYELIVISLMLLLNAVFAAYEMGIASISSARIRVLAESGKKGAAQAFFMKDRMEGTLSTIQIGITVVGMIAAATGGAGIEESLAPFLQAQLKVSANLSEIIALFVFVVPLSLMIIIFAELTPKMFAIKHNENVVLFLSPAMKLLFKVLYPVVVVIEAIVKKITSFKIGEARPDERENKIESLRELKAAVSIATASRLLGKREEKIVLSAAQLSLRRASEVMIPVPEVFMLWAGSSISDAFLKAHMDMHTRFPVCDTADDPQTISGYINFKDILTAAKLGEQAPTLNTIKRPIMKIDSAMPLSQLLETMVQGKVHIVLVTDKAGAAGIITLEDILEELVGEIGDEYDVLPSSIKPYGSAWLAGGGVSMDHLRAAAGLSGTGQAQTLAEWCALQLGRAPAGGEAIEGGGLRVLPRKFRRGKMVEAMVSVLK